MASMLIPYALKNGSFVHVSSVERGLACGCCCPLCGGALVKRVFESKQKIDHFAHHGVACGYAPESILHLLGKHFISKAGYFYYPSGGVEKNIKVERASLEVRRGIYRIDIVLNEGLESELLVEVVVNNPVDRTKQNALLTQGSVGVIVTIPIKAIQLEIEKLIYYLINSCEWKSEFSAKSELPNDISVKEDPLDYPKEPRKKSILIRQELIPYWSKYYNNIGLTRATYEGFKKQFIIENDREPNQQEVDSFIVQLIETERESRPKKAITEPKPEVSISEYLKASRGS